MASNQGNFDSAANTPLWAAASVNRAPTTAEATALYGNTSSGAYFAGETIGVFAVDSNEAIVDGNVGTGWVLRTTGSGGRAGRVQEEVLTVVSTFRTDNNADDALYPDASISITTQPSRAIVRANTSNSNSATFSVSVDAKPIGGTVSYVWQYNSLDGSQGWTNVLNGVGNQVANVTFSGNTSSTLTVTPSSNFSVNTSVFRVTSTSTPAAGITNATAASATSANAQVIILAV